MLNGIFDNDETVDVDDDPLLSITYPLKSALADINQQLAEYRKR